MENGLAYTVKYLTSQPILLKLKIEKENKEILLSLVQAKSQRMVIQSFRFPRTKQLTIEFLHASKHQSIHFYGNLKTINLKQKPQFQVGHDTRIKKQKKLTFVIKYQSA